jgi:hypothetical protein
LPPARSPAFRFAQHFRIPALTARRTLADSLRFFCGPAEIASGD